MKNIIFVTILILSFFVFFSGSTVYSFPEKKDIKLEYDVSVNAVIIPVFALDKKGNPVFDLKKKDIVLYVDGNPVEINSLSRYSLEEEEKYSEKVKKTIKIPVVKRKNVVRERYIFILIDSIFNSRDGYRRTKEIAEKLINQGKKGDKFIVIEHHPLKGLNYIGGPETGNDILIERIKALKLNFDKWSNELFRQRLLGSNLDNNIFSPSEQRLKVFLKMSQDHLKSDRMRYRNQIIRYSNMLSKFKYALKSITKPKLVFLISEGMSQGSFLETAIGFAAADANEMDRANDMKASGMGSGQWSILWDSERKDNFKMLFSGVMLGYLKNVVKAINQGNSVLYSINPAKPSDTHQPNISGDMSLRYLAGESGGKYYTGTNTVEIVERINKNTSAYYELSFLIPENMKKNLHVKIRCKRKGVKVNTVQYTELKKNYADMDKLQKQVFAYNLAKGGKWSNLIAKVVKEKFIVKKTEGEKENTYNIEFPKILIGKHADIYIITEDPATMKIDIKKRKKVLLKDIEEVKIKKEKDKRYYLVVVEPEETLSISLQLK
ncbi:MAG: hypothetical protein ABFR75_00325 [Acidobacteriota bacterium]